MTSHIFIIALTFQCHPCQGITALFKDAKIEQMYCPTNVHLKKMLLFPIKDLEKAIQFEELEGVEAWVNFTNILFKVFTRVDPKSAKKSDSLTEFFALLGSESVTAVRKMLMKLTPGNGLEVVPYNPDPQGPLDLLQSGRLMFINLCSNYYSVDTN